MLDATLRKLIDPPLATAGRVLARTGVSANALTLAGLGIGACCAIAAALQAFGLALFLLLLNRLLDGLDGAVARAGTPTDVGGYLDIVSDFVLWAMLPLGFAIADPQNVLAAAVLLASFIASGTTFLGYAILAAKAGEQTDARGDKSFFHLGGLTEGTETILFFVIVLYWPASFTTAAFIFAALAAITAFGRVREAARDFRS